MRGKRSKQYRKVMHAYALSFDFRVPYQVLLDAEFIKDAARFKMKLGSMLENTLHGEIKPMITQCCIRHLYNAEVDDSGKADKEKWIEVAKQAERRRCGHHELEEPLSALECIESVVDGKSNGTNKHRYVVASQDRSVREAMRAVAGVPLIYINRSVMILEPLAPKTEALRQAAEVSKRKSGLIGRRELVVGEKRQREAEEDQEQEPVVKKKRVRGPKGPNPLSMKKAKSKTEPAKDKITNGALTGLESEPVQIDNSAVNQQAPVKRKRKRKPKTERDGNNPKSIEVDGDGD